MDIHSAGRFRGLVAAPHHAAAEAGRSVIAEGGNAIDWGIYGAPETFLVDANGVIRWKHVGPISDEVVRKEIMPMLQQIEGSRR